MEICLNRDLNAANNIKNFGLRASTLNDKTDRQVISCSEPHEFQPWEYVSRKTSNSYNIGNAPNIYGDTSYNYSQTDSYTSDTSSDNYDSFNGFGGGGDFSGGGASGDWQ